MGPLLVTVTVYVLLVTGPDVVMSRYWVIDGSSSDLNWSVSVDELLPRLVSVTPEGAATVAVLLKVPVRRSEERRVGKELGIRHEASVLEEKLTVWVPAS